MRVFALPWLRSLLSERAARPFSHASIRAVVTALLAEVTGEPAAAIRDDASLVKDLQIDGDDYGMWFVPEVEHKFGLRLHRRDWESVHTVADIVTLIADRLGVGKDSAM